MKYINKSKIYILIFIAFLVNLISITNASQITGAGASFPAAVYIKWSLSYNKETGIQVIYQSVGSTSGVRQITNKLVDFGATDKPLNDATLEKMQAIQFPAVSGAIVVLVNLNGIDTSQIVLTPQIIADIYLKKITLWDDPRIAILNPDIKLPKLGITPIYRAEGSGTTFNFTKYLSMESTEFKNRIGSSNSVPWITGIGAKGNEGVAALVKRINGSIAYLEYGFSVIIKKLPIKLKKKSGEIVSANPESIGNALKAADWSKSLSPDILNVEGKDSWPITIATFIIMNKDLQKDKAKLVMDFFNYSYTKGKQDALDLQYIPLPDEVVAKIKNIWTSVYDYK